jgi:AcrR family transcriptional regulator
MSSRASNASATTRGSRSARAAMERSAQARREDRFRRLVAAGRLLMQQTASTDFSVPDVAAEARTSLRAFYEFFANKDALLIVVFEQAIQETAVGLREAVAAGTDPAAQLEAYVRRLFGETFDEDHPEMRAMIGLHLRLAVENPAALAQVLAPQDEVLLDILRRGVAARVFRTDIDVAALAMVVSQTLIAVLHTKALAAEVNAAHVTVDEVWRFCHGAVRTVGR